MFKKGDIIKEIANSAENIYGLVVDIKGREVWCYWAKTLEDLKKKRYAYDGHVGWIESCEIKLIKEEKKIVKQFGIVAFCKKYYK